MRPKIVLAGGSGFLGASFARFLVQRGYEAVILSRNPGEAQEHIRYVKWDGATLGEWARELEGCRALVNYTGKSVNCIYTPANREEILASRINAVKVLQQAAAGCSVPPPVFIQAGSLAIYGDTREVCDEMAPAASGFSAEVCKQWENAFFSGALPGTRQVLFRIGFALGRDGGALEPLVRLVRWNLGGTVGSGKQYISWLHMDDLNQMFLEAIEHESYEGIYNATGPNPTTNKAFMGVLRKVMGKGWAPPAPAPLVRLGAYVIMKTEPDLALTGRNCIPKRLSEAGFRFLYPDLETALSDLVGDKL